MKALLIIDMQQGSFTEETPRHQAATVVNKINSLGGIFRSKGWPVIFIQHDGSKENEFIPGSEAWKLLPNLNVESGDDIVSKTANDAFYATDLEKKLKSAGVLEIVITGCATDFCVDTTVRAALTKDFNVAVISDGHTTADRPNLSAEQVIKHHNWIWENMSPTKGKISVVSYDKFAVLHAR